MHESSQGRAGFIYAEIYCFCTDATTRLQILSDIAPHINTQFSTEMISYLEIETQTLYLAGRGVRVTEQERIEDHALRCLEGVDKSSMDETRLGIQGLTLDPQLDDTTPIAELLWTGAVERGGRLKGVLTIYGEHRGLSAIEKQLLRRLRTLIADGFDRLSQRASVNRDLPQNIGVDVFALSIDTPVERGDITGLVMTKLQDAVAKRLAEHIPDIYGCQTWIESVDGRWKPQAPNAHIALGGGLCGGVTLTLEDEWNSHRFQY